MSRKQYTVKEVCNPIINVNIGDTVEVIADNGSNILELMNVDTSEWFIIERDKIDQYFIPIER